jgi:hypothetical protein
MAQTAIVMVLLIRMRTQPKEAAKLVRNWSFSGKPKSPGEK